MALIVPNPNVPTNGQALDATPLLANLNAVYQAVQSFDGSQIVAGSVVAAAMNAAINPNTLFLETTLPFVSAGCVWTSSSSSPPVGTMTSGVVYINGKRVPVNTVASHTFTASKDTYIDIDVNGNITYIEASNNGTSPALTANSIRVAIIVTNATAITTVNQGGVSATAPVVSSNTLTISDSIGNRIYPTNPNGGLIAYRVGPGYTTVGTSTENITGANLCNAIIPAGRNAKITVRHLAIQTTTGATPSGLLISAGIAEGATSLDTANYSFFTVGQQQMYPTLIADVSPSTGLHTYSATLTCTNGSYHAQSVGNITIAVELV